MQCDGTSEDVMKIEAAMAAYSENASETLSPRERARLAGILSRLSSSFDGERAAAGLLATEFVAKHNLAWSDLVDTLRPADVTEAERQPEHAPQTAIDPLAKSDRRRGGSRLWRGYCRRHRVGRGAAVDLST